MRRGGADDDTDGVEADLTAVAVALDGAVPGAGSGTGGSGSMGIWGKSTLSRLPGGEWSVSSV
jgi:hypothetical protein